MTGRSNASNPLCMWCHAPITPSTKARGWVPGEPVMPLFPAVKVIVCGGACPAMPDGAEVGQHPQWQHA